MTAPLAPPPRPAADPPLLRRELALLAPASGAAAGAGLAAYDALLHARALALWDALLALLLGGAAGVVLGTPPALLLGALARRRGWSRGASGSALLALIPLVGTALLLAVQRGARSGHDLALLALAPPVALAALAALRRRAWLARPWSAALWASGAALAVAASTLAFSALRTLGQPRVVLLAAFLPLALLLPFGPTARRPWRRGALVAALALAVALLALQVEAPLPPGPSPASGAAAGRGDAERRPDVVLVVLDTTRRDRLGCYGHAGGLTPALDALAAEGVVYEDAVSPAPWTVPSHATLFTGLHPVTHGASYEHHLWLDADFTTLAELLRAAGYQTVALNSNPFVAQCNLLQGFERRAFLVGPYERLSLARLARDLGVPARWVDAGGGEAVARLRRWLDEERDPERPFFLFVNLFEAHAPYLPPRAQRRAALPEGVSFGEATRFAAGFETDRWMVERREDERAQRIVRAMYEGEVRYQDRRLEELLGLLGARVELDDALIVVTADHGENLGEGGAWDHLYSLADRLVRVPLVVRYPRAFPAGERRAGTCQTTDVLPTVLASVGLDAPAGLPGRSLAPARFVPRTQAFGQVSPFYPLLQLAEERAGRAAGVADLLAHWRMLRTAEHKLLVSSRGETRLYDLRADPDELDDVAARHPELVAELRARLESWWSAQAAYDLARSRDRSAALDAATMERLRGIGYAR